MPLTAKILRPAFPDRRELPPEFAFMFPHLPVRGWQKQVLGDLLKLRQRSISVEVKTESFSPITMEMHFDESLDVPASPIREQLEHIRRWMDAVPCQDCGRPCKPADGKEGRPSVVVNHTGSRIMCCVPCGISFPANAPGLPFVPTDPRT